MDTLFNHFNVIGYTLCVFACGFTSAILALIFVAERKLGVSVYVGKKAASRVLSKTVKHEIVVQ